ncbi:MAG: OBAP family protein [Burkholderiaceae bacterium]
MSSPLMLRLALAFVAGLTYQLQREASAYSVPGRRTARSFQRRTNAARFSRRNYAMHAGLKTLPLVPFVAMLLACGGSNTGSNVSAPGAPASLEVKALEAGAAALQNKPPIEAVNTYLNGFHFYSGQPQGQMEAHHYCTIVNEEVIQCVIYDGNVSQAKLMGVEYIVSERLFKGLPKEEKALWHSHAHEVKSGQLLAPGIPEAAETALMRKLVGTYGKTFHTWHTDLQKDLPVGVPQLMMGFTGDGQARADMVAARDARLGIDSAERKRARADIPAPAVAEGADAWQQGAAIRLADPTVPGHAHGTSPGARPGEGASRP